MTDFTNCRNCGAPVDLTGDRCPYCGTPYPRPKRMDQAVAVAVPEINLDAEVLARAVGRGIITPNEARRRMGLREI